LPAHVALVTAQTQKGGTEKYSTAMQASVSALFTGPSKQAFAKVAAHSV
jgi:hypothetical protein